MRYRLHNLFKMMGKWLILLFIIVTAVIFFFTLMPSDSVSNRMIFSYDKIGHGLAFAAWTLSLALMLTYSFNKTPNFTKLLIYGLLFGFVTEIFQRLFPINRAFEILDVAADLVGIVFAILLFRWLLGHLVKDATI